MSEATVAQPVVAVDAPEWDAIRVDDRGVFGACFSQSNGLLRAFSPPRGALAMHPAPATSASFSFIIQSWASSIISCDSSITPAEIPSSRPRRGLVASTTHRRFASSASKQQYLGQLLDNRPIRHLGSVAAQRVIYVSFGQQRAELLPDVVDDAW